MSSQAQPPVSPDCPQGRLVFRLSDPEFRSSLQAAEVIVALSTGQPGRDSLVYGSPGPGRRLLAVEVDFSTDDLEALIAVVSIEKGTDCYTGECSDWRGALLRWEEQRAQAPNN